MSDHNNHREKLESLGVLSGAIAHDLNNLLTGVLGHISILRLSLPKNGDHAESLVAIEDGARRAARMTEQILEFARGETREQTSIDIAETLRRSIELLKPTLSSSLELVVQSEPHAWVHGDEGQLGQLIMNLTVNARDAVSKDGRIEVSLKRLIVDTEYCLTCAGLHPGEYICFSVLDSGPGISEDVIHKIFEPFFTTKKGLGTGLGLSTVQRIVQAHSGVVRINPETPQGAHFEVYLPCAQSVAESVEKKSLNRVPEGTEKILVVDDEEAVRTVIQRCLEHLGYEVVIAGSGAEALETYRNSRGEFSLVILDMMMPSMAGDDVFRQLQSIDSEVPVLIASGYSSNQRAQAVLDGGGLGFLQKPFAVEELASEVRRCLDGAVLK